MVWVRIHPLGTMNAAFQGNPSSGKVFDWHCCPYSPVAKNTEMWLTAYIGCLTSSSRDSAATSWLGLDNMAFTLASALGSTFGTGLIGSALASTCFGSVLGSRLGAGFGVRAGLGWRFGNGFVSALLDGLLTSLDSTLFSETDGARWWTDGALSVLTSMALGSGVTALDAGRGASSSSGEMRLFLTGTAAAGVTFGAFASESNFCSGLISRSEPCSFLLLWRLGVREGPRLLGAPPVSAVAGAGAETEVEGVAGRLPDLLLALLPPLLPPALAVLSSFQLPGLRSLGSSLLMMPGLGEGVRPGDEPGMRLSSSFMSGLSGGVGRGSSSASSGSCMTVSVFSLPSTTSCNTRFFRYSGPERPVQSQY